MSTIQDFSLQGKVYLGNRDANGQPEALQWVGDASVAQVALATQVSTRQESFTGNRLEVVRLQKSKTATFTLTLSYFSPTNLALALYGNINDITTGTVTAETLPATLNAGDSVVLDHRDVSNVVITDSTTSAPKTLVEGTDYTVDSPAAGIITLVSATSGFVLPLKAAYSYAAAIEVPMFTTGVPERYMVLDGINTVDNSRVKARLYRCVFDPAKQLDLVSADLASLELTGSVLYDSLNAANSNFGGFGKIELPGQS